MKIVGIVDIETTGIDQEKGHRIIELALALYKTVDGQSFTKAGSKTYVWRINPMRPIDEGAQAVHGISLADLVSCPEWEDVAPTIHKLWGKCDLMVAHNVPFDLPFIALEFMRVGLSVPSLETFCTMQKGRDATAMGKVPNLGELCWALDVDYDADEAHAADYDVDVTAECLIRGCQNGLFNLELFNQVEEAA